MIPKLLDQKYSRFEVILVDDRSQDETYDYGIKWQQEHAIFKLVRIDTTPDHIHNKKYAITLGIKAAQYDHILLTDADCVPHSDQWISEMSGGFQQDSKVFAIGYSPYLVTKGFLNLFIRYETLHTALHYVGLGLLGRPYMAVGRNIAYKKSFFLENNGFGKFQHVVGGDDDLLVNQLATRKNTSFILSPESAVYSKPKTSWKEFVRQKTRHMSVGKHYKFTDKVLLGLLSLSKIGVWVGCIAVILSGFQLYFALGAFILVMVSLLSCLLLLKKKTGDKTSIWMLPFLDFAFLFYYISTGLKVLLTKKVRWK